MKMVPIVKPLSMWAPVINGVMDMEPDDSLGEPGDAAADIDNDGAIVDMGDPAIEIASPMQFLYQLMDGMQLLLLHQLLPLGWVLLLNLQPQPTVTHARTFNPPSPLTNKWDS
ncbi:uncharacterized protein LOC131221559 isoform X3 [Magnolia sinica]|uniref:uncharacterized protein LOC131221559 isoform X3 n=1 Tax=Magnolia sinica TaxID=86752 RepID=UPI002657AD16|nr:uncharacterized protein LOC131221559 isoform X3 [Magnolia sinica]